MTRGFSTHFLLLVNSPPPRRSCRLIFPKGTNLDLMLYSRIKPLPWQRSIQSTQPSKTRSRCVIWSVRRLNFDSNRASWWIALLMRGKDKQKKSKTSKTRVLVKKRCPHKSLFIDNLGTPTLFTISGTFMAGKLAMTQWRYVKISCVRRHFHARAVSRCGRVGQSGKW